MNASAKYAFPYQLLKVKGSEIVMHRSPRLKPTLKEIIMKAFTKVFLSPWAIAYLTGLVLPFLTFDLTRAHKHKDLSADFILSLPHWPSASVTPHQCASSSHAPVLLHWSIRCKDA